MNKELIQLSTQLALYEKFFSSSHRDVVEQATQSFLRGDFTESKGFLSTLPSQEELLASLLEKLKGKSVYKTLQQIMAGKCKEKSTTIKGLFSLGTHIAIECEQGHAEYGLLYEYVYEKLGELLYE